MSDTVRITNLPDSGSHERVAYDLWNATRGYLPSAEGKPRIQQLLDLYVQCRVAAYGSTAKIDQIS